MTLRNLKKIQARSLVEAFELCGEYALQKHRLAPKALSELMDVPLSTYYRWISEASMPAGRIRQFQALCGCRFVTTYQTLAEGMMVLDVPIGRRGNTHEIAELQKASADAISLLIDFYASKASVDETIAALDDALRGFGYHRANLQKVAEPELGLFGEAAA